MKQFKKIRASAASVVRLIVVSMLLSLAAPAIADNQSTVPKTLVGKWKLDKVISAKNPSVFEAGKKVFAVVGPKSIKPVGSGVYLSEGAGRMEVGFVLCNKRKGDGALMTTLAVRNEALDFGQIWVVARHPDNTLVLAIYNMEYQELSVLLFKRVLDKSINKQRS